MAASFFEFARGIRYDVCGGEGDATLPSGGAPLLLSTLHRSNDVWREDTTLITVEDGFEFGFGEENEIVSPQVQNRIIN